VSDCLPLLFIYSVHIESEFCLPYYQSFSFIFQQLTFLLMACLWELDSGYQPLAAKESRRDLLRPVSEHWHFQVSLSV